GSRGVPPRFAGEASTPPRGAQPRGGESGLGTTARSRERGREGRAGRGGDESFNTVVAQGAEITIDKDSKIKVDRVVCAVDCGIAVNPDIVKAQMEGGIGFGLSAALYS